MFFIVECSKCGEVWCVTGSKCGRVWRVLEKKAPIEHECIEEDEW